MIRLLIFLLIITTFSCNSNQAIKKQLSTSMIAMDEQIVGQLNNIRRTNAEYGFEPDNVEKPLKELTQIFNLYNQKLESSTSKEEIYELLNQWNSKVSVTFPTKLTLSVNKDLDRNLIPFFARQQLRIETIKLYEDFLKSIIPPDPKFSNIKPVIRPEIRELRLGEVYYGEVYLGVTAPNPESFIDFYYENQLLEFDQNGFAKIEVKPKKRGLFTIEVEARGKPKSQITKDLKFTGTTEFRVK